jgi:uncharacterized protein YjdB
MHTALKTIGKYTFLVLLVISYIGVNLLTTQQSTHAVSGSDWRAGNIMSDTVFFDNQSMSAQDIQNFLNSKVPACDTQGSQSAADLGYPNMTHAQYAANHGWPGPPYVCLKDYYQVPDSTKITDNYSGSIPSGAISAAQIIKNAADTYNISPKVLLTTLHKESLNLIFDTWPLQTQYTNSMGYGCPDTAACDPKYAGFYNQMMNAAYQFNYYRNNQSQFRYQAGQTPNIYWNPNSSCGSTPVTIANFATAGLYNYTPYQPNTAALNNLYGSGDDCSAYGNRNFWRIYNDWFGNTQVAETILNYKSHLSSYGWTDLTTNSGMTGTVGQSRPMEGFKINGEVEYSSYSQTTGWQPTVNRGMISGTTGLSRPIEAIKINPIGSLADNYDLYYRVQVSKIGWMGWAKNGLPAGAIGNNSNNIEAIEIYLSPKGFSVPGSTSNTYQDNTSAALSATPLSLSVTSHVGNVGWQPAVTDSMVSGTTEQSKRVEAMTISLNNNTGLSGNVVYSAHVATVGWQPFVSSGQLAGTTGKGLQMEAIRIGLTGQLADNYDVWYRGYVKYQGWQGWTKNTQAAGSAGVGLQLEAVETRLLPKGSNNLTLQSSLYNPLSVPTPDTYNLNYSTHRSNIGWVAGTTQNAIGGTTGQSRTLESLRFDTLTSSYGDLAINCSVYSKKAGWTNNITMTNTCGTVGQTDPLEGVKLSLTGSAANKYDIYYRVHLSLLGWQGWVKNGDLAGNAASNNNPVEAIQVKLVEK